MAQRVSKNDFEEKVLKSTKPVLVDFYSDSCIPCKMISPILGELEEEKEDVLEIYKINVNFDGEIAEKYSVLGVPTLMLFEKGDVKDRKTGALNKQQLFDWIKELLEN